VRTVASNQRKVGLLFKNGGQVAILGEKDLPDREEILIA